MKIEIAGKTLLQLNLKRPKPSKSDPKRSDKQGSDKQRGSGRLPLAFHVLPNSFIFQKLCPEAKGKKNVKIRTKIGSGKYGKVYKACWKESGIFLDLHHLKQPSKWLRSPDLSSQDQNQVAVKCVRIGNLNSRAAPKLVMEELEITKELQECQYIVNYHGCYLVHFPTPSLCMILDYEKGGDARKLIKTRLKPKQLQSLIVSILLPLQFMHERGIVHKDIKPENLLISQYTNEKITIKVCDFGAAERFNDGSGLRHWYGTMSYLAPEYLQYCVTLDEVREQSSSLIDPKKLLELCDDRVDIWALGIFLLELYFKQSASRGVSKNEIIAILSLLFREDGTEHALDVLFFRKNSTPAKEVGEVETSRLDDGGIASAMPRLAGEKGKKKVSFALGSQSVQPESNQRKIYWNPALEKGIWKPHERKEWKEHNLMFDFISKCLTLNSRKRLTATKLLQHPFIKEMARAMSMSNKD
mmetsp:Transcript_8150/g.10606  ORF Transcript_8150/g.10606 Transcript_8150/m.10606 type:complete len:470 (+) Transcript_8150:233-1642(+)|eukprot:CAMPEP_0184005822 /NCGR_PEP_ID=MMETSP0954-20121128/291_1 /TAXON_ID=627963 /ORGANISM="Aplanochytrium sp, Strain PBS07" /LENGTH=469 /DNA_ID=CAMNT_0026284183 /DNA_START=219 /DNA_END=1628 /DNA_ORIENTATION=+